MKRKRFLLFIGGLAMASLSSLAVAKQPVKAPAAAINPATFVGEVDNKFFPLKPGTTFFYEGMKDGLPTSDAMDVTHKTKNILGVKCTVVRD